MTAPAAIEPLLAVDSIDAFYGGSQALFGASLVVGDGQFVALMGRNGMGKTTTVRSIVGLLRPRAGRIAFAGSTISHWPSYRIARLGLGLVPEGRLIFPTLTVRENLVATAANFGNLADPWTIGRVFAMFPRLAERSSNLGSMLSGGEQQMLAIGRALMLNPRLLILDEATEGLAPLVRDEIWRCLRRLKSLGHSILIVDKNLVELSALADRVYVMEKGRAVWAGTPAELGADTDRRASLLGV